MPINCTALRARVKQNNIIHSHCSRFGRIFTYYAHKHIIYIIRPYFVCIMFLYFSQWRYVEVGHDTPTVGQEFSIRILNHCEIGPNMTSKYAMTSNVRYDEKVQRRQLSFIASEGVHSLIFLLLVEPAWKVIQLLVLHAYEQ